MSNKGTVNVFTLGPPTSAPRRRWGLGPLALNVSQVQAVGGEGQADAWNTGYKEYNFKEIVVVILSEACQIPLFHCFWIRNPQDKLDDNRK